jgi:hypothetical protein
VSAARAYTICELAGLYVYLVVLWHLRRIRLFAVTVMYMGKRKLKSGLKYLSSTLWSERHATLSSINNGLVIYGARRNARTAIISVTPSFRKKLLVEVVLGWCLLNLQ